MASIIGVETLQHTNGTTAATIDSSGKVGFANAQKFMQDDGTYIDRPHFEAYATTGTYNHTFNTSNPASFSAIVGGMSFYAINNVHGGNTTGFTTSTTNGGSYYKVPVTGIYHFDAGAMMNTSTTSHVDMGFYITDKDDTFSDIAGLRPWSNQATAFTSNTSSGVRGFTRSWNQSSSTNNLSVTIKLFEGQHVRPAIVMNTSFTGSVYLSNHNYWHGTLIGQ